MIYIIPIHMTNEQIKYIFKILSIYSRLTKFHSIMKILGSLTTDYTYPFEAA